MMKYDDPSIERLRKSTSQKKGRRKPGTSSPVEEFFMSQLVCSAFCSISAVMHVSYDVGLILSTRQQEDLEKHRQDLYDSLWKRNGLTSYDRKNMVLTGGVLCR